jgi:hypothetical protein
VDTALRLGAYFGTDALSLTQCVYPALAVSLFTFAIIKMEWTPVFKSTQPEEIDASFSCQFQIQSAGRSVCSHR